MATRVTLAIRRGMDEYRSKRRCLVFSSRHETPGSLISWKEKIAKVNCDDKEKRAHGFLVAGACQLVSPPLCLARPPRPTVRGVVTGFIQRGRARSRRSSSQTLTAIRNAAQ